MEKCSMFDSNMGEWNREREREKLFRTILTLIRNFYLFVFSPTFFVVYLSFNKMYIHIFPIKLL